MHKSISPVIAMIMPGIINLMMENIGLPLDEASEMLYNSKLYEALEDEGTKVRRLSYAIPYDLSTALMRISTPMILSREGRGIN